MNKLPDKSLAAWALLDSVGTALVYRISPVVLRVGASSLVFANWHGFRTASDREVCWWSA